MGRRGFHKIRTKVQRRERAAREGDGDPILGWSNAKAHRWAMRTLIRSSGDACALCGESVELSPGPLEATIDHIVPLSRGGLDVITNMQLAHRSCNQKRGNAPLRKEDE